MFVLCRWQCSSAQPSGSVPTTNDLVSIGQTLALLLSSEFMNATDTYRLSGDVSIRVQNPEAPHLVPSLFDGRMCLGAAGAAMHSLALQISLPDRRSF